eukprot:1161662-Pelagomonas_calceolata.AAC.14
MVSRRFDVWADGLMKLHEAHLWLCDCVDEGQSEGGLVSLPYINALHGSCMKRNSCPQLVGFPTGANPDWVFLECMLAGVQEMQSGQPMSNDAFSVTCVAARGAHGGHSWHQCQMEMHIVDTPGTNVILERQQRLTEEYVPRADLVLFVMSVDRAFSESEVVGEYVPHTLLVLFVTSVDGAFSEGEVGGGRDGMRVLLRTDLGAVYEERGEDHPLHGTGFVGSQHEGTCLVDWTVLLAACWEVFSICTQDH